MGAAIRWAQSDQELAAIKGNRKVPFAELNKRKYVAVSGSQVINQATGSRITNFEYSSKAVFNIMRALQRHLSAKQYVDSIHLEAFKVMTSTCLKELTSKMKADNDFPRHLVFDYPSG